MQIRKCVRMEIVAVRASRCNVCCLDFKQDDYRDAAKRNCVKPRYIPGFMDVEIHAQRMKIS